MILLHDELLHSLDGHCHPILADKGQEVVELSKRTNHREHTTHHTLQQEEREAQPRADATQHIHHKYILSIALNTLYTTRNSPTHTCTLYITINTDRPHNYSMRTHTKPLLPTTLIAEYTCTYNLTAIAIYICGTLQLSHKPHSPTHTTPVHTPSHTANGAPPIAIG